MTGRAPLSFMLVGGAEIVMACGQFILSRGHGIAHVIGRSPAVREWARERGLPCAAEPPAQAGDLPRVDHIISAANDLIIDDALASRARAGAFNLHNSVLPDYRGAFATLWAILDGRTAHGTCWHRITARIDAGPVVATARFPILPEDTARTLNARCMEAGFALFREQLVPAFERGEVAGTEPPPSPYYPVARRAPALGVLDWRMPAARGARIVRALSRGDIDNSMDLPKVMYGRHCWSVGTAECPQDRAEVVPGKIRIGADGRWLLGMADGALRLDGMRPCAPVGGHAVLSPAPARPPSADAVPDDLTERAQCLGRAAARVEPSALHGWASALRLPPLGHGPAPFVAMPAGDGDWRAAARSLIAAAHGAGGGAFRVDLPITGTVAIPPALGALFCPFVPFAVSAHDGEAPLAERLAQAAAGGPMLIDAWNRRTLLRAAIAENQRQTSLK